MNPNTTKADTKPPPPTVASEFLSVVSSGDFDAQCSRKLTDAIEACIESGGKAKLVITVEMKLENRMMVFKPTVKTTLPTRAVDVDMFYVDENTRLTKQDPKQMVLSLPRSRGEAFDVKKKQSGDDTDKGGK